MESASIVRTNPSCALALPAASQHLLSGRIDCTTVSWETGHSPFLNRPDLVGSLLVGLSVG